MRDRNLLAEVSKEFLKKHKVYRYRMKKVAEMNDEEIITCCHWYCEENGPIDKWIRYREEHDEDF